MTTSLADRKPPVQVHRARPAARRPTGLKYRRHIFHKKICREPGCGAWFTAYRSDTRHCPVHQLPHARMARSRARRKAAILQHDPGVTPIRPILEREVKTSPERLEETNYSGGDAAPAPSRLASLGDSEDTATAAASGDSRALPPAAPLRYTIPLSPVEAALADRWISVNARHRGYPFTPPERAAVERNVRALVAACRPDNPATWWRDKDPALVAADQLDQLAWIWARNPKFRASAGLLAPSKRLAYVHIRATRARWARAGQAAREEARAVGNIRDSQHPVSVLPTIDIGDGRRILDVGADLVDVWRPGTRPRPIPDGRSAETLHRLLTAAAARRGVIAHAPSLDERLRRDLATLNGRVTSERDALRAVGPELRFLLGADERLTTDVLAGLRRWRSRLAIGPRRHWLDLSRLDRPVEPPPPAPAATLEARWRAYCDLVALDPVTHEVLGLPDGGDAEAAA